MSKPSAPKTKTIASRYLKPDSKKIGNGENQLSCNSKQSLQSSHHSSRNTSDQSAVADIVASTPCRLDVVEQLPGMDMSRNVSVISRASVFDKARVILQTSDSDSHQTTQQPPDNGVCKSNSRIKEISKPSKQKTESELENDEKVDLLAFLFDEVELKELQTSTKDLEKNFCKKAEELMTTIEQQDRDILSLTAKCEDYSRKQELNAVVTEKLPLMKRVYEQLQTLSTLYSQVNNKLEDRSRFLPFKGVKNIDTAELARLYVSDSLKREVSTISCLLANIDPAVITELANEYGTSTSHATKLIEDIASIQETRLDCSSALDAVAPQLKAEAIRSISSLKPLEMQL